MAINLDKIDLRKKSVINLKKISGLGVESNAQVFLALDYSYSMSPLYQNGTVQDVVEKILPFGLAFDDNGEVDFHLFEDGQKKLPQNITLNNIENYISRLVIGKYEMGGTNYAPVLKAIYNECVKTTKGGFFSKAKIEKMKVPVYVIFITDGNNSDKFETEEIIRKMSHSGIFIQFIGIGSERFEFLSKLDDLSGRKIDNVNFLKINNISTISDDELYNGLMSEYPNWVKLAKKEGLIF